MCRFYRAGDRTVCRHSVKSDRASVYIYRLVRGRKALKRPVSTVEHVATSGSDSNKSHSRPGELAIMADAKLLRICSMKLGGCSLKTFLKARAPWLPTCRRRFCHARGYQSIRSDLCRCAKNIGPAGLTVIIVRKDLCGKKVPKRRPLDYAVQADADSMSNTPPTYGWYLAGLVFAWARAQGGLQAIAEHNAAKAKLLYDAIDGSNFYTAPVHEAVRSTMNVPFTLADAELDKAFLSGAEARGLFNLKGHRSVGGMRASIYNAVPMAAVESLVSFMSEFENEHG